MQNKNDMYIKRFDNEIKAREHLRNKNKVNQRPYFWYVLVDGQENDFAVVDMNTAIDLRS